MLNYLHLAQIDSGHGDVRMLQTMATRHFIFSMIKPNFTYEKRVSCESAIHALAFFQSYLFANLIQLSWRIEKKSTKQTEYEIQFAFWRKTSISSENLFFAHHDTDHCPQTYMSFLMDIGYVHVRIKRHIHLEIICISYLLTCTNTFLYKNMFFTKEH